MKLRTYLRWMGRESRGARGRMLYFAACLAVGVAAIVGTSALGESIEAGFRAKSREILGADFKVDARRPLPEELTAAVNERFAAIDHHHAVHFESYRMGSAFVHPTPQNEA